MNGLKVWLNVCSYLRIVRHSIWPSQRRSGRFRWKGCKLREFKEGEKVYCIGFPDCAANCQTAGKGLLWLAREWEVRNYKIYREGKKKRAKVIHINCLKKYLEGASICRLDVVVEDDTES